MASGGGCHKAGPEVGHVESGSSCGKAGPEVSHVESGCGIAGSKAGRQRHRRRQD